MPLFADLAKPLFTFRMSQGQVSGRRKTADGSYTLWSDRYGQTYHSVHGALTESQVVFLENGLELALMDLGHGEPLFVLEMGFGTGLNAFLTFNHPATSGKRIHYASVEQHPLAPCQWHESPLADLGGFAPQQALWTSIQMAPWQQWAEIGEGQHLLKWEGRLQDFNWTGKRFHVVYFDAFSPQVQPELWSTELFSQLAQWMRPGGILVTYCSQGQVQRNLKAAGWQVEKRPGPPGKREMVRAFMAKG